MAVLDRLKSFLIKANNRRVLARNASKNNPSNGLDGDTGNQGIHDGISIILRLDGGAPDAALSRLCKTLRRTKLINIDIIVLCAGEKTSHQACNINNQFNFWQTVRLLCCPSGPDDRQDLAIRMALRAGRAHHAAIISEHLDKEALSNLPTMIIDSLRHSSTCSTGTKGDDRSHIVVGDRQVMLAQIITREKNAKDTSFSSSTMPIPAKVSPRKQRIGGMATMPSRMSILPQCLEQIAPQLDELHLYLNGFSEVPKEVLFPNVIIHGMGGADLKETGKFPNLPHGGNAICIALDDDIAYPSDYVDCMEERLGAYGDGVAIGLHASIIKQHPQSFRDDRKTFCFYNELASDRQVHLLGTGTIALSAQTLADLKLQMPTTGMSDIWFACSARKAGIRLVAIARPAAYAVPLQENGADSLYLAMVKNDSKESKAIRTCSPWPHLAKPGRQNILVPEEQFLPSLDCKFRPDHDTF